MPSHRTGDSGHSIELNSRMKIQYGAQWQGNVQLASPDSAVLGDDGAPDIASQLHLFEAAEPAIELEVYAPQAAVLGEEETGPGALEYQPQDDAVYALLHAIQTPDGTVFDFTLPERRDDGGMVLGGSPGTIHFPINPIAFEQSPPSDNESAVLGLESLFGGAITGEIGGIVAKRIVQVIKTPFEQSLLQAIRKSEGEPWVGALGGEEIKPLQGFESWRSLIQPGGERKVLLFIHGFSSSLASNHTNKWIGSFAEGYDAVIGYNHPTIWCDPEQNARALLEMIPDDIRMSVDLLAHSRGGLVARSLVELVEPLPQFTVRRVITNGTPNAGTRLADPARWDRLVSIGMTAASWLAGATGAAIWIPTALEWILKAASQVVFDLPGIGAMTPEGDFIKKLNAPGDPSNAIGQAQANAKYTAISSRFSVFGVSQPTFQQAFNAFAAQAFMDSPNDMVVPTESMTAIDKAGFLRNEQQLLVGRDHFSYFDDKQVIDFIRKQLAS